MCSSYSGRGTWCLDGQVERNAERAVGTRHRAGVSAARTEPFTRSRTPVYHGFDMRSMTSLRARTREQLPAVGVRVDRPLVAELEHVLGLRSQVDVLVEHFAELLLALDPLVLDRVGEAAKDVEAVLHLEDGRARTLEEVGREFVVTEARVRQIEASALRKVRSTRRSSRKVRDDSA